MFLKYSYEILYNLFCLNYKFVFEEDMFKYIKYKLLISKNVFVNLFDILEGLDKKILKEVLNCNFLNKLILKFKSKRYIYIRINRILV